MQKVEVMKKGTILNYFQDVKIRIISTKCKFYACETAFLILFNYFRPFSCKNRSASIAALAPEPAATTPWR
jgi:hypothetical protein